MYHLLLSVCFDSCYLHVPQKGETGLEIHPCLVFALYSTFCFKSLADYKFSKFAVVFYIYDAAESYILRLKKTTLTLMLNMYFCIGYCI